MSSQPRYQANQHPAAQGSNLGDPEIPPTAKSFTPERVEEPPALIAVIGWKRFGKTTFVNNASGSRLETYWFHGIQASNEFELDGQRVVLIDTPGIGPTFNGYTSVEGVKRGIESFLARSYPTGTKLAGIVFVQRFTHLVAGSNGSTLSQNIEAFKGFREDKTLKNLVIMAHDWKIASPKREQELNAHLPRAFRFAIEHGAQVYRCTGASKPDLGALRIILGDRRVAPKVQQESINGGSGSEQTAVAAKLSKETPEPLAERYNGDIKKLEKSTQDAVDKTVEELRQELEEQKRGAKREADEFEKRIAEMQSKESVRMEMVRERFQELEEQKRRMQEEADDLRKCIAEMQSKLREDRHGSACLPLDRSSPQFANRLNEALHGQEYVRCVENFQEDDLVWFVDYLDKALDSLDPSDPASRKCLRELGSICATHTTLPTSYTIPSHLLTVDSHPFAYGGFGEVYCGTLDGSPVCVKRLRVATKEDLAVATKMLCKEAVMWKTLKHPYILPLLGATVSPFQLISALMPAGDLSKYLPKNLDANRIGLLSEIAEGLCYLHSRNVIHGDLKGVNILVEVVDNIPHARIADFGVTIVTKNVDSIRTDTCQDVHTPRWSAPEILRKQNPTKESDVYSFAMVTIEVLTGEVPFSNEKTNWMVVVAVLRGDRPSRPEHPSFTDGLWWLIQRCWNQDPHLRPEIPEVSQTFASVSTN